MRKLIYIANARIPTEKAHGKQIVKTCEAIAKQGVEVELWLPQRKQTEELEKIDACDYYGADRIFKIRKLPTIDWLEKADKWPKWMATLAFVIEEISFDISLVSQEYDGSVVYSRSITAAMVAKVLGKVKVYYEIHNITENKLALLGHRFLWKRLDGLVVISTGLEKYLRKQGTFRVLVAGDAVDLDDYSSLARETARKELGLSKESKIVVYAGSLEARKGIDNLVKAAGFCPETEFILVGRGERQGCAPNICYPGYVLPQVVPYYLKAADVLVLPSSAILRESREFTSPMKLFEYLASGVPIVATDTPANREILSLGETALLVTPDSPTDLAKGMREILNNKVLAHKLSAKALAVSKKYSWDNRARQIVNFLTKTGGLTRIS